MATLKQKASSFIALSFALIASPLVGAQAKFLPPEQLPSELLHFTKQVTTSSPGDTLPPNGDAPAPTAPKGTSTGNSGIVRGTWTLTVVAPTGERYSQTIMVDGANQGTFSLPSGLKNGIYTVVMNGSNLVFLDSGSGVSPTLSYNIALNLENQQANITLNAASMPAGTEVVFDAAHRIHSFYFTITSPQ